MHRRCTASLIVLTTLFCSSNSIHADESGKVRVYFGTYTNETSKGIYQSVLDTATGKLSPAELAVEIGNPSFLAIHPTNKYLYAVNEISEFRGQPVGSVSAFSIDSTSGRLKLLNQESSGGAGPCHLVVDSTGKQVLVANYGGGSVAVLPILNDGHLKPSTSFVQHHGSSVNKDRQSGPRAHSINLDRANKFAVVADLGLDKILIYRFEGNDGILTANKPPAVNVSPGRGPRHFAFHPSVNFAFVNNELTSSVTSFTYNPILGSLTEIDTLSTLPESAKPQDNSTAEVVVHPSGKFVYVSNRGHDSLAIFQCDQTTGRLTASGHQSTGGKTPRNFSIDHSGQFLLAANQSTNNVVVFRIDLNTGALTSTGHSIEVGSPVCIRFLPIDL